MEKTLTLIRQLRILVGKDLMDAEAIFKAKQETEKAVDLARLGDSVDHRHAILAGLVYAVEDALPEPLFRLAMYDIGMGAQELAELLTAAQEAKEVRP